MSTAFRPTSTIWPAKAPSFSASATKGFSLGASSAVTEGLFSALVTAPVSR